MSSHKTVFLTGATGLLGQAILYRLSSKPIKIYCLIRGYPKFSASQRLQQLLMTLAPHPTAKIEAVQGDLSEGDFGLADPTYDAIASETTQIIHCAAQLNHNNSIDFARALNVEGTKNILRLAERCSQNGRFSHLDHVSTAYVAGRRSGIVLEGALEDRDGFRNPYERSKYEAELLVRAQSERIPTILYRPSIIWRDDAAGPIEKLTVLDLMVRMFMKSNQRLYPRGGHTYLDIVPLSYVADAMEAISEQSGTHAGRTFHLVSGVGNEVTTREFVSILREELHRKHWMIPSVVYRYIVKPLLQRDAGQTRLKLWAEYFHEDGPRFDKRETEGALACTSVRLPNIDSFLRSAVRRAGGVRIPQTEAIGDSLLVVEGE